MLSVEMTPRLLGFEISGTYHDLDELYDAIWDLTVPEYDSPEDPRPQGTPDEATMSTRLLALCYDLRMAKEGNRNVELTDSGMSSHLKEAWPEVYQEHNVTFSVEVLYPEAMYEALALVYLSDRRERYLSGNDTYYSLGRTRDKYLLDKSNAIVHNYLARLLAAVEKKATPARYRKVIKDVCAHHHNLPDLYQQWVDEQNFEYADTAPEKRAERLSIVVRRLANFDNDESYRSLKEDIDTYARNHNTWRENVRITGDYESLYCDW